MNVTLRQLRAAIEVAEHGSFRRAADALHVSQPALSLAIAELEGALGITLFDRTSRSVAVTEVGIFFVQGAKRVVGDLDRLINDMSEVAQSRRGRVSVTCVSSIAGRVMPLALHRCAQAYPELEVTVQDDVAQQVLSAVVGREVDFGLTISPGELPEGTCFEPLKEDPFHLVCHSEDALAKLNAIPWKALNGVNLILLSTTSGIHQIIHHEMVRQSITAARSTPVSHLSTVHGMLESGYGVAVLPALALPVAGHPTLVARPMCEPVLSRTLGVLYRRDRSFSPAAAALLEVVRSVMRH
jgi:DNA-binding transcriptional LysR family regulator